MWPDPRGADMLNDTLVELELLDLLPDPIFAPQFGPIFT
jgi:hypothetical protein